MIQYLAAPLAPPHGTLVCRGTPVGNHCSTPVFFNLGSAEPTGSASSLRSSLRILILVLFWVSKFRQILNIVSLETRTILKKDQLKEEWKKVRIFSPAILRSALIKRFHKVVPAKKVSPSYTNFFSTLIFTI